MTLLSPSLAAWYFHVPLGTVYRWASQDQWAKHGTLGRREYDITDIEASYLNRRAAQYASRVGPVTCGEVDSPKVPQSAATLPTSEVA